MEDDQKSNLHRDKGGGASYEWKMHINMATERRYNPNDPEQQFYRENTQLDRQGALLSKLGWRIADLSRDEEDLALQCMALLTNQLIFPITVSMRRLERGTGETREQFQSLWMQVSIHTSNQSKDFLFLNKNAPQAKIFHFCQNKLLPLLKDFFKTHLDFDRLLTASDGVVVLELFRSRVVASASAWMEEMGLLGKRKE